MAILFKTTSEIKMGSFLKGYSLQTTALLFFFLSYLNTSSVLAVNHVRDDLSIVFLILAAQAKGLILHPEISAEMMDTDPLPAKV